MRFFSSSQLLMMMAPPTAEVAQLSLINPQSGWLACVAGGAPVAPAAALAQWRRRTQLVFRRSNSRGCCGAG